MAMKQFDEIFREKVKETFSNYNADHLADKGWQSFISRRRKRFAGYIFLMPVWAKAAAVALIITAGSLLTYILINRQNEASLTEIHSVKTELPEKYAVPEVAEKPETEAAEKMPVSGDKNFAENIVSRHTHVLSREREDVSAGIISKPSGIISDETIKYVDNKPVNILSDTGNVHVPDAGKQLPVNETDSILIAGAVKKYEEATVSETDETEEKINKSKSSVIAGISGMMAVVDNALATSPGVSAGVYYEYQFTRRIAIRPGVAIAMHSSPVENRTGRTDLNYAVPLYDGTPGTTSSYEARLRLIALEVPVNMVFKVIAKEKSSLFLSAGASTLIYLNQKFNGTFVNSYTKALSNTVTGEMTAYTNYSTVEVEKTESAFSHADYFGLANLSAGYSIPFGKSSMLIEPYLQMPLSGITSLNIKIYYSGISLKLKFGK